MSAPQHSPDPLKLWRSAQARATLAGFVATLTQTDDGRPELVVSRWALARAFDNLADLERWIDLVTGRR